MAEPNLAGTESIIIRSLRKPFRKPPHQPHLLPRPVPPQGQQQQQAQAQAQPPQQAADASAAALADARTGLSDDTIRRLHDHARHMTKGNGGRIALPQIFLSQCLKALTEAGLARLSASEILSLIRLHRDIPDELLTAIAVFLTAHPPNSGDYLAVSQMIQRGSVIGISGLAALHKHAKEQAYDRARKRAQRVARAELSGQEAQQPAPRQPNWTDQMDNCHRVLGYLYEHRFGLGLKPYAIQFVEALAAYPSHADFDMSHRQMLLQIAHEAGVRG